MREKNAPLQVFIGYFRGERYRVFLSLGLILVQALSVIPVAALLQRVLDHSIGEGNTHELILLLGIIAVLFFINALALIGNRYLTLHIVKGIVYRLRTDLVRVLLARSHAFYTQADLDALHSKIVHDSERLDWMSSSLLAQFIPGVLIVLGLSAFLLFLNPLLFVVIILVLPAMYVSGRKVGGKVREHTKAFHEDFSRFSAKISFALKFSHLIKVSTAEDYEYEAQKVAIGRLQDSSRRMAWLGTVHTALQNNALILAGILVLFVGGIQVIEGVTTLGSLLSFYVALNLLSAHARNTVGSIPIVIEGLESLRSLAPLLADIPGIGGTKTFAGLKSDIRFEGVSFSQGTRSIFTGINISIPKGSIIGIYGASGSGKSTFANLLTGLYEPTAGTIYIDGVPLHELDHSSYRARIGVLPQESMLFSGTVRENLVYGLEEVADEELIRVCSLCRIHEDISMLEEGYDTIVGDRGARLSGGQKKRIALARTLLRKPDILVLDEPDASLDAALAHDILAALTTLGMTVIVITHDARLQKYADKAYEFVEGEMGTILIERTV